ncbi:MAG: TonB-dependent receptor [Gammaproteobacteria bacterium]
MTFRMNLRRAAAVACASLPWIAAAAAEERPLVDELVVSAFRETGAERLPASITVLDGDLIRDTTLQHFQELIEFVPNLNFSGDGNRARYLQIRGIGELEQYQGAPNPSVGFLVDDIDLSGVGSAATLFDAEQVDVLRGPQGTRHGANALAGLIFVKSADPTEQFESRLEATAGTQDTFALGGMISGPVGERAGYRAAVQKFDSDGFRDNAFLGRADTNGHDELTARGKLRFELSDAWRIDLAGLYADIDAGYDAWAVDNNGETTYSDKPGRDAQETAAGSLRVTGEFGDALTFVSITSVADTDAVFSFDADWGNDDFWNTPAFGNAIYDYFSYTERERDTVSQEFRLVSGDAARLFGRVDWVVGVYGLNLDEGIDVVDFGRDDFFCVTPCVTPFSSAYDSESRAVFGELVLPLGDAWRLDVGLRWETWEAKYADGGASFSPDDDMLGGHLNLSYQLSDATMIYGRVARGYKAGGFNLDANAPPDKIRYDAETLWNYEGGIKYLGRGGTLRADLVLFWMERDDMQGKVPVQDTAGNPIAFSFLTDNAEQGTNRGLEASIDWSVSPRWMLHGALGWLNAEIDRFDYVRDLQGRDQAHAPRYNFALGATWRHERGWFGRVDVTGKDAFYYDYSHDERSQSYQRVNLRVGRDWGAWSLFLWGRNIFDETYTVRGFYFGNEPPAFADKLYEQRGEGRLFGVTLRHEFQ